MARDRKCHRFLVFIGISVAASLLCRWFLRKYIMASLCAGVISASAFQLVVFLRLGYVEPLFLIAFGVGLVIAVAIAGIVGIPFVLNRRPKIGDHRV